MFWFQESIVKNFRWSTIDLWRKGVLIKSARSASQKSKDNSSRCYNIGMKKGYHGDIEKLTISNENFRKVVYTAEHSQLVLMSLLLGEEIGSEVHEDGDQFFRFEKGQGKVVIDDTEYDVKDGDAIIVPAGSQHNVINSSTTDKLKLYTIYSPAHHKDGVIRATKKEAEADSPEFDGTTTE